MTTPAILPPVPPPLYDDFHRNATVDHWNLSGHAYAEARVWIRRAVHAEADLARLQLDYDGLFDVVSANNLTLPDMISKPLMLTERLIRAEAEVDRLRKEIDMLKDVLYPVQS